MPILPWRAKQSTDTVGTGTLMLNAAPTAGRSFNAAFGSSPVVGRWVVSWQNGHEEFIGIFDGGSPGTLTRSTVLASSNGDALVSLPAGTKDVFPIIDPGERRVFESTADTVNLTVSDLGNFLYWTGTSAGTVNLPAIAGVPLGADFEIRNDGTALLTVDANASETINGQLTLLLAPGEIATIRRVTPGWVTSALPGEVFLRRQVASNTAALDFTLPGGFTKYRVEWGGVRLSVDGTSLGCRISMNGGASFAAGASDYSITFELTNTGGSNVVSSTHLSSVFSVTSSLDNASSAFTTEGALTLWPADGTRRTTARSEATVIENGGPSLAISKMSGGFGASNTTPNAIRLLPSSGNISIGAFSLYGVR